MAKLSDAFPRLLGSSPRTTIIGYLGAALFAVMPLIFKGDFVFKTDWPFLLAAAYEAIKGRLQKDSNGVTAEEGQIMKAVTLEDAEIIDEEEEGEVVEPVVRPIRIKKAAAVKKKATTASSKRRIVTRQQRHPPKSE